MSERTEDPQTELNRYLELLEPLEKLAATGSNTLPPDETAAWDQAVSDLSEKRLTPVELEEVVSTFARVLWSSSAWAAPPSHIAEALRLRSQSWPEAVRDRGLDLARRFADRALSIDSNNESALLAAARIALALGELTAADRHAASLPADAAPGLVLRSEVAEANGDNKKAIRLRKEQLKLETEPGRRRNARANIGRLYHAAGDLTEAIEAFRENLREYPDNGPDRLALAHVLRDRGLLLDAFSEAENAALVGEEGALDSLADLAGRLDRSCLDEFRKTLRTCRDGDAVILCPQSSLLTPPSGNERAES